MLWSPDAGLDTSHKHKQCCSRCVCVWVLLCMFGCVYDTEDNDLLSTCTGTHRHLQRAGAGVWNPPSQPRSSWSVWPLAPPQPPCSSGQRWSKILASPLLSCFPRQLLSLCPCPVWKPPLPCCSGLDRPTSWHPRSRLGLPGTLCRRSWTCSTCRRQCRRAVQHTMLACSCATNCLSMFHASLLNAEVVFGAWMGFVYIPFNGIFLSFMLFMYMFVKRNSLSPSISAQLSTAQCGCGPAARGDRRGSGPFVAPAPVPRAAGWQAHRRRHPVHRDSYATGCVC